MAEQPIYKCDFPRCDYTSKYNHNILRHKRHKHRVTELPSDYDGDLDNNVRTNSNHQQPYLVPEPEDYVEEGEQEEEGITCNDLEAMISDKINDLLKTNDLPPVGKLPIQSAMKNFMSGSTATLIAGMCLGYLITANAPVVLAMMKGSLNGFSPAFTAGGSAQQQEMMRQMLAQQRQATPTPVATGSQQQREQPEVVSSAGLEDCLTSTL